MIDNPQKIIIDTDPGIDDTMAILFALRSPELDVVGLTSVFGNSYVEVTTQNALRLVELEGNQHIPVVEGAAQPLVGKAKSMGMHVHGYDGMGNSNPPPPTGKVLNIPAAQFIVREVMENPEEITLVPIGPLTNIALALRLEPRIVENVKEVVIMGGSAYAGGNASPVAEANIYNDPYAANIVFSAGWSLTMLGLDATLQWIMTREYLDDLCSVGNPATDLIRDILPFYQAYLDSVYHSNGDIETHDPSAIAYLIDSSLFSSKKIPMYVETIGSCAGQTVPDIQHLVGDFPEINVCLNADSEKLSELYKERLTK